jgi:hypothetical protein
VAVDDIESWNIDAAGMRAIDEIVRKTVLDHVGPEFMAPPLRTAFA